jgi:hypothetical protein
MTKFYTKDKKVRPITNRQTTIGSYQTGTAHLSVPKRISKKPQWIQEVTEERKMKENMQNQVVPTIRIPYAQWIVIQQRIEKLDMPVKIQNIRGLSVNDSALYDSGLWYVLQDYPEYKKQLDERSGGRINFVITENPRINGKSNSYQDSLVEKHEINHIKYDQLPEQVKNQMIQTFIKRSDSKQLLSKLEKQYKSSNRDELIEEYYVRMATDALYERIWLGAKPMPQTRQWKLIDTYLKD